MSRKKREGRRSGREANGRAGLLERGGSLLATLLRLLGRPPVWTALLLVLATGAGLAWGSWRNLCATCPSVAQIRTWEPEQATKILARDGRLIIEQGIERRTPVSIDSLPPHVPQAVIAIEDKRFYRHGGVDPRGLARAVVGAALGRSGISGGGSTITQQLARNMFSEIGFERKILRLPSWGTITRKLKEAQVAFQLEDSYTKDQILQAYLNQIYMGRGHGFENASRAYLGKPVAQADVAEAALLAAILNRPTTYDPFRNPGNALARRNLVLDRMAEQGYLSGAEAAEWKRAPLPTEDHAQGGLYGVAPYFEEWVRQHLRDRFGEDVLYRGGLRVFTTLDLDVQRSAVEAMEWGWQRIEDDPRYRHPKLAQLDTVAAFPGETPYIQGSLIALDPHTGQVLAMVGGRDFEQSKFDRVRLAERQAGSSFKPFVYAAAISSGIPASHIVMDEPLEHMEVDSTFWRPRNFSGTFEGPMTLREALTRSVNIPAIRLAVDEVGLESVAQTARRLGIQTRINRFPSSAIGAADVRPLQMAESYTAFATLGTSARAYPILRVENAWGEVLWEWQPERTPALDSLTARIMVSMLGDAANGARGTGGRHRSEGGLPYEVPTAGKTGTTNDAADVWFVGFTPNLVAAVWFGMDRPQPILRAAAGDPGATGGAFAAPVWGRFMRQVYYGETNGQGESGGALPLPEPWPLSIGLTTREVDRRTGRLWSNRCGDPQEHRYVEVFIPGTEPTQFCDDPATGLRRVPPGVPPRP